MGPKPPVICSTAAIGWEKDTTAIFVKAARIPHAEPEIRNVMIRNLRNRVLSISVCSLRGIPAFPAVFFTLSCGFRICKNRPADISAGLQVFLRPPAAIRSFPQPQVLFPKNQPSSRFSSYCLLREKPLPQTSMTRLTIIKHSGSISRARRSILIIS